MKPQVIRIISLHPSVKLFDATQAGAPDSKEAGCFEIFWMHIPWEEALRMQWNVAHCWNDCFILFKSCKNEEESQRKDSRHMAV